ncbi:MAG: ribonuclease PH [Clostridiales bacterium]|nr:ribonuclease PH [Clostridiales bacterium]
MERRPHGRGPEELRPLVLKPDVLKYPEGSCLVQAGDTMVLCTVTVEPSVPAWRRGEGLGWLTAEYGMLPRATEKRTPREATRGRQSGRTLEIQRLIGRSLRAALDLEKLGERTLWVDCDVLQADGGTRTASITGGLVAVARAVQRLLEAGELEESPLLEPVAAVSVGWVGDTALLDLDFLEDFQAEVDLNVVATARGRLVEVQGTAEGQPMERSQYDLLLDLALKGIAKLVEAQKEVLASQAHLWRYGF